jgi:hypothetical protein
MGGRWALCAALSLAAAKRVSVSEMVVDSPIASVEWLGKDDSVEVIALTVSGNLYMHNTKTNHWDLLNEEIEGRFGLQKSVRSGADKRLKFRSFQKHPKDPNIWMLRSRDGRFFVHDGKNMLRAKINGQANGQQEFLFHKTKPQWALLSMWRGACGDERTEAGETGVCRKELYATPNLFQTEPRLVATHVAAFAWGPMELGQQDTIYFSQYSSQVGDQPSVFRWDSNLNLMSASIADKYQNAKNLLSRGNRFLISNGYIFVVQASKQGNGEQIDLMISTDGAKTFHKAMIPTTLDHQGYAIIDTSEDAVVLFVNHEQEAGNRQTGNVYISDKEATRFTLALENVATATGGIAEFDLVQSLDGVYMSNVVWKGDDVKDADMQEEEDATSSQAERSKRMPRKGKTEAAVRTTISWDKGGEWHFLKPPLVDSKGKNFACAGQPECNLHLHGNPDFKLFPPYYSVPTATGLVIGVGNVGTSLRSEGDEVNTYLSRDGGVSWQETMVGPYIYEFGDHGGLVVMASTAVQTQILKFSWNEGGSWYEIDLSSSPLDVDNIVTSPNFTSTRFVLYGTRGTAGVIIDLDFSTLGQPTCTGVWGAGSSASDYEVWMPSDGRNTGRNCLLGREVTYTRRRPTSECFNGEQYERKVVKNPCDCSEEDYECEFGFRRKVDSKICEHMGQFMEGTTCGSNGFVVLDSHRKVPGNGCQSGWSPTQTPVPCNSPSHTGRTMLIVIFLLLVVMATTTALGKSTKYRAWFTNTGFDAFRDIQYAAVGAKNALGRPDEEDFLDDRSGDADVVAYTAPQGTRQVATLSLSR